VYEQGVQTDFIKTMILPDGCYSMTIRLAYNLKDMVMPQKVERILHELKKGLVEIYSDQLQAVYLFGSFARGEGRLPDSDIDVMIVLNGEFDYREVQNRSVEFIANLCLENDVVISWFFVSDSEYIQSRMPFMLNVRDDAVMI
jgi:predicted nucleotidyltransferase